MILSWKVLNYNCNANKIEEYDVLSHKLEWIKKAKKKCKTKEGFSDLLEREMMWQYWSRAEYELILVNCNGELWLEPWCGCRDPEAVRVDVSNDDFWRTFALNYENWWDNRAKIDIYDQLKFKWTKFVDYCWNTHLPYERSRRDE